MAIRTSYPVGTFSWVDLPTTDTSAAKEFYGSLFGWEIDDRPMGDSMTYTMLLVDGEPVAALYPLSDEQRKQGVKPNWNNFVTVDSVDKSAEQAKKSGGKVVSGPFDVMSAGRMAALTDPSGAPIMIWEPKDMPGAGRVNEQGALCWNELQTTSDGAGIEDFYQQMFNWKISSMETGNDVDYKVIKNGERPAGGIASLPKGTSNGSSGPHWVPYFATSNFDQTFEKAKTLGAKVCSGPIDMGPGKLAIVADPQGAVFGIWAGELDS